MAKVVKSSTKDGEYKGERILLNPYEKGQKYFQEIQDKKHYTNNISNGKRVGNDIVVKAGKDGRKTCKFNDVKKDRKTGKEVRLSDTQIAYRQGYLAAQKDSRKAYKAQQEKDLAYEIEKDFYRDLPYFD